MPIRFQLFAIVLTLSAVVSPLATSKLQDPTVDGQRVDAAEVLAQMDWLAGSWSGDMWGGTFHAHYSTPEGGVILSHSKLLKDEREAFYEFELFEVRGGTVHLQPFPGGKKVDGFQLQSHDPTARVATFENPDKDYPTRIVYHCPSKDELVITLTDPHGGSEKVEQFELSR